MLATQTNRTGLVWCGAGAVSAMSTQRASTVSSTGSPVKLRTVRRSSTASRRPCRSPDRCPAGTGPRRWAGSATGRPGSASGAACQQPAGNRDRDRGELALHQVAGRGEFVADGHLGDDQFVAVRVDVAARSASTSTPAAPMATSVTPSRQARPWVSVTTTPTSSRARRTPPAAAPPRRPDRLAAARSRRRARWRRRPRRPPRRCRAGSRRSSSGRCWATSRTDSSSISLRRNASRASGRWGRRPAGPRTLDSTLRSPAGRRRRPARARRRRCRRRGRHRAGTPAVR